MTHDANEELCQYVDMTEHDYEANNGFYAPPDCQCVLIAKVREETLAAAREAVVVLCWRKQSEGLVPTVDPQRVLAAIDALRENRETPPPLPPSVGVPERRWT